MRRSRIQSGLTLLVTLTAVVAGAVATTAQEDDFFPNTRERGRAAVEYQDADIHVVAAYYYSQFNHDTRWLHVQTALSTEDNVVFDRENIRLVTPAGREIALATQARVGRSVAGIRPVVHGGAASRHDVLSYFNERDRAYPFELFSLSSGAVQTNFVTHRHHVAYGDLFFESPTGLWEDGTYTLVIERDDVRAALPIELE